MGRKRVSVPNYLSHIYKMGDIREQLRSESKEFLLVFIFKIINVKPVVYAV